MDGNSDKGKWSIQFRDLPEVVQKRPVTSRLVSDVPIVDSDSITAMAGLGYRFVSTESLYRMSSSQTQLAVCR